MEILEIETSSKRYPVFIGENVVSHLPEFINTHFPLANDLMIITDETVGNLYLDTLTKELSVLSKNIHVVQVPDGEHAKTFEIYYKCQTEALEKNLNRKSVMLALGGGAVGDLTGFVAATFMRGIPFIQVPTTILAHDSAVGGKVAINHPAGKNMIGAFYQPEAVFYDLSFLPTLPENEIKSGFAEVIKHGLIQNEDFYYWLVEHIKNILSIKKDELSYSLKTGIEIKSAIVKEDELEQGIRAYLNFGHTLGHVLEKHFGYGNITHGEGVMIGMVFALKLSIKHLNLDFDIEAFKQWVSSLGYRTSIPSHFSASKLVADMKRDKKSIDRDCTFVLLSKIGEPCVKKLKDEEILTELQTMFDK